MREPALVLVLLRAALVLGGRDAVAGDVARITIELAETLAAKGRVRVLSPALR